jgi:DNA polymerase-4
VPVGISTTLTLTELATDLACAALADHPQEREITLLAVSVANLVDEVALQLELPLGAGDDRYRPGTMAGSARWVVDRSVDAVRARFGRRAVGYAAVVFSDMDRVPEAFRELAERDPS